jgi:hypothetical protein
MSVSYEDAIHHLCDREGELCGIAGYLSGADGSIVTDPDGGLALHEDPGGAPGIFLRVSLGPIESGTFDGHAGNRAALLDDDGIEVGRLTLSRDSFVNAAFDPRTGALHIGMAGNAAAPALVLVEHEEASVAGRRNVSDWVWSFNFE